MNCLLGLVCKEGLRFSFIPTLLLTVTTEEAHLQNDGLAMGCVGVEVSRSHGCQQATLLSTWWTDSLSRSLDGETGFMWIRN